MFELLSDGVIVFVCTYLRSEVFACLFFVLEIKKTILQISFFLEVGSVKSGYLHYPLHFS
ncbi:hypothetical protein C1646_714067 [Rhizophagus diaphanus]|nr:hypothetical protein C1646_714067 [Rhizophagus diaphanus] [Rhizophagus sp. MUCL 43196]